MFFGRSRYVLVDPRPLHHVRVVQHTGLVTSLELLAQHVPLHHVPRHVLKEFFLKKLSMTTLPAGARKTQANLIAKNLTKVVKKVT